MNATISPEYRKLEIDTSNDMIRYDARWGDRKYVEAALHIRNAGFGRLRMGQIMFDAEDVTQAACDWLSAAACFGLVPDLERMKECFERARKLDQEGKIPPERRDIHAALKEREKELKALDEKLKAFYLDYVCLASHSHRVGPDVLEFLLQKVRELPGNPRLHAMIARQAQQLGQLPLATKHMDWAEKFDPGSHHLGALRVSLLVASGETDLAITINRKLLKEHPEMGFLRVLLAQTISSAPSANVADLNEALQLLDPLVQNEWPDPWERILGVSLSTTIQYDLCDVTEYHRLLELFDLLAQTAKTSLSNEIVSTLRMKLPNVFPKPGRNRTLLPANGRPSHLSNYSATRDVVKLLQPLSSGPSI